MYIYIYSVCVDAAAKAEIDKMKKDAAAKGKYRYVLFSILNITFYMHAIRMY